MREIYFFYTFWTQATLQETRFIEYMVFGIMFVPKMEMRLTFRPTEMVPEKKINSAMNGPQNA